VRFLDPDAKPEGEWPVKLLSKRKRRTGKTIRNEAMERYLREKEASDG
jgi:hypothetical protein